jgi:PhoH-like ATPase
METVAMRKLFVLDTNVLLHNAACIESFADNVVVLPMAVIEELDQFKSHNNEPARNARQVIRTLDGLRTRGSLRDGVPMDNGGVLKIVSGKTTIDDTGLDLEVPDNKIIRVAYNYHRQGERVIFVSKDINARLKADALGLTAVDFEKQKINFDELYTGYSEASVPAASFEALFAGEEVEAPGVGQYPNEFVLLENAEDDRHTALARVVVPGKLKRLDKQNEHVWNIRARNKQQRMALELLMDTEVQLVTLVGQAGTGKTLLALAAALQLTLREHAYDRILVSRPIIPMGRDIGYLPGDKEEKLSHWMQPIFDNLAYLLRDGAQESGKKKHGAQTAQARVDQLLRDNTLALEALTYIRGRSIPDQFVIVDEAQNLTPHEIKTIVSRSGEGTKMVLTGDPYQIDNPFLDASSNGLTYAAERLKEHAIHGQIMLKSSERSKLAGIAAEYL